MATGIETREGMIAAAEAELVVQQRRPMGFWKTVVAVVVGLSVFSAIVGSVYYLVVIVPQQEAARARSESESRAYLLAMDERNAAMQADNDRIEAEIKLNHPGSPCNVLSGSDFTDCLALNKIAEQRKFVAEKKQLKK